VFVELARRIGLTVACVAAVFAVVLPAQPAGAWWDEYCKSYPKMPFMIDHKLMLIDGSNQGVCQGEVSVIVVEATLQRWLNRSQTWQTLAHGERTQENTQSAWGTANFSCSGMGPAVFFRTAGEQRAVYGMGSTTKHSAISDWREVRCGGELPLIQE
jgi:hypothetical protein